MKKIALLVLIALCSACNDRHEPQSEPSLIGEWELTWYGKIIDSGLQAVSWGDEMYRFNKDGTGWLYISDDWQESFKWSLSGDQLEITDRKIETDILISPGSHYINSRWTVHRLTTDELMVSYLMLPNYWTEEPAYEVVSIFERIR